MNIFIRTSTAQYRVDIYNALYEKYNFKMCFFDEEDCEQHYKKDVVGNRLKFVPYIIRGPKIGRNGKFFLGLFKIIREEQPDVIIVPEFKACLIQVLLYRFLCKKKYKIISMCDDSFDMVCHNNDFTILHHFARKVLASTVDDILLVEKRVVCWYRKFYKRGFWLPIIRDESFMMEKYRSVVPVSRALEQKYDLFGKKIVLFVGRLVQEKNLFNMINAFGLVKSDAVFVIVGEGVYEKDLKALSEKSKKRVLFTGRQDGDELYAWYNIADVFTLVSIREAFGAVINEALLAGNYCVVSNRCGGQCLIDDTNGCLVNPENVTEIAGGIDQMLARVPICKREIEYKGNKMNVSFDDVIDSLKNVLNSEIEKK